MPVLTQSVPVQIHELERVQISGELWRGRDRGRHGRQWQVQVVGRDHSVDLADTQQAREGVDVFVGVGSEGAQVVHLLGDAGLGRVPANDEVLFGRPLTSLRFSNK